MHYRKCVPWLVVSQAIGLCVVVVAQTPGSPSSSSVPSPTAAELAEDLDGKQKGPAEVLLRTLELEALREIAAEALERNPDIARAKQVAAAFAARAPQVRALPDPVAALNLFVLPPETRAGPQRLSVSIQQKLPWFGKLALKEQAALYAAAAVEARVETIRLDTLTEVRRIAYELAFLEAHERIVKAEHRALVRYEESAQARYAAGTGLQQEIVRIQTQITRTDTLLLEISERRFSLQAAINTLRDRPADDPVGDLIVPPSREPDFDRLALLRDARSRRPELAAAAAEIEARTSLIELAEKNFRPDLTFGLAYTVVERRQDVLGDRLPDDGDDILALSGSLNLPVWRRKLAAGVEEAHAMRRGAEQDERRVLASIEGEIGDLTARMPLLFEHLHLLESVLLKQAREGLRSAETAYSTGKLNAVDLLDAEFVMFEVQIAAERTRTDFAVAQARLERAIAGPIEWTSEARNHDR